MEQLIKLAEDYGLKQVIETSTLYWESVQGVLVTLDPWWLLQWSWFGPHRASRPPDYLEDFLRFPTMDHMPKWYPWDAIGLEAAQQIDFNWKAPFWYKSRPSTPLMVIIALRPGTDNEVMIKLIENLPRQVELPVVLEVRSLARLASNPKAFTRPLIGGLSLGAGTQLPGTLGGIVEDRESTTRYALTCWHVIAMGQGVVDQPSQNDSRKFGKIGKEVYSLALTPSVPGAKCNPYGGSAAANEYDLSLIELDKNINSDFKVLDVGYINGCMPKNLINPGLSVEVSGRTSGYRRLTVRAIAVYYQMIDQQNGKEYCCKNLFQVGWAKKRKPLDQGDSGAWVCAQGASGTEWLGMILGIDSHRGYAMLAENVLDVLKSQGGYDLRCA